MATATRRSSTDSDNSSVAEAPEADSTIIMERFLERTKTDLMYELRNIEHGRRPVTGQSYRENLQQFMEKHRVGFRDPSTSSEASSGKENKFNNIPANVDSVEKHRPEAVIVEVQAVVELRPVSSVLQSAAFRRHLENIVRGSLTNRQPVNAAAANSHSSTRTWTSSGTASSNVVQTLTDTPVPVAIQTPEIRPQFTRQISTESNDSFCSARSSYEQDIDGDFEEVEDTTSPPEETAISASPRSASPRSPRTGFPRTGFPRTVDSQEQDRTINEQPEPSNGNITWNDITSLQREEIVGEISELLHSRLVSSTLGGEFRTVLEMIAQNHLASSGTDGRAVQDFISTLPRTGVQRNDFSHLGVVPVQENDNWDNISVTSVSAHSVPHVQTNSYLAREIVGLRSQMNEMKNMLKLTFDLQMDIQRAIRQEVAAAINDTLGATGDSSSVPRSSKPVSDSNCLICLERHTDTILYQCGHMCVCFTCGRDLVSRGHRCPVCRAPIKDVIRAYRTNAE